MANAVIRSGSYMFYGRHIAIPDASAFALARLDNPNYSGRMDNLRAAILRPQLKLLDKNRERWNARYRAVEAALQGIDGLTLPHRPVKENYVGSSIQFLVEGLSTKDVPDFINRCQTRGVELKWFGSDEPVGYTSRHVSWRYLDPQTLPQTDFILRKLCDMRIPLSFSIADYKLIGKIIAEEFTYSNR